MTETLDEPLIDVSRLPERFGIQDEYIAELSERYAGLCVEDEESYQVVKAAHTDVTKTINLVERKRKEFKEPALTFGRAVDAEAKRITEKLEKVRKPLADEKDAADIMRRDALLAEERKAEEARQAAIKAEQDKLDADRKQIEADWAKLEDERKKQDAEREHVRMLNQEIDAINMQQMIAVTGRSGVRKGGTIACVRETLAETEAWIIDPEYFGDLTAKANRVKDDAIAAIKQVLAAAEEKEKQTAELQATRDKLAAIEAEQKAAQKKIDDAKADADRQEREAKEAAERAEFEARARIKAEADAKAALERQQAEDVARLVAAAEAAIEKQKAIDEARPDLDKLKAFAQSIRDLALPSVTNVICCDALLKATQRLSITANDLDKITL